MYQLDRIEREIEKLQVANGRKTFYIFVLGVACYKLWKRVDKCNLEIKYLKEDLKDLDERIYARCAEKSQDEDI